MWPGNRIMQPTGAHPPGGRYLRLASKYLWAQCQSTRYSASSREYYGLPKIVLTSLVSPSRLFSHLGRISCSPALVGARDREAAWSCGTLR